MQNWLKKIGKIGACSESLKWANQYDSLKDAWAVCERGDWMLWLLGKLSGAPETKSRKKLVLTSCQCARLSLKYVKEGENRPFKAIETAEKWARGEAGITLYDVGHAADAAYAADSAAAADAAYAAAAAAYAADAADASYAATAAYAAAAAAAYAAYTAAARFSTLKECADIVRKSYKTPRL